MKHCIKSFLEKAKESLEEATELMLPRIEALDSRAILKFDNVLEQIQTIKELIEKHNIPMSNYMQYKLDDLETNTKLRQNIIKKATKKRVG